MRPLSGVASAMFVMKTASPGTVYTLVTATAAFMVTATGTLMVAATTASMMTTTVMVPRIRGRIM